MSNTYVPHSFGGTLILGPPVGSIIPTLTVIATFRSGVTQSNHRDGRQNAQHRDGNTQTGGR
jgi:hypothetical protein